MTEWLTSPKRDNPEERLQMALVQHLIIRGQKNAIWYAVPNGIPASRRTGGRFKAQGMKSGIFDLAFVLPDGRAAFLEMKAPSGRLSPTQKQFQEQLVEMKIEHAVVSDLDTALRILEAWGVIK